jgi:hypothetical protein
MLDKNKFIELMSGLAQIYNKEATPFMLDMYYKILNGYDYNQIDRAVEQVVRNNKYNTFPKPADILEYLEGTKDDKALVAWLQLMEAVEKGGYYQTIEFKDPIISHCVIEIGGWMAFCSSQKEELPFIQKRFMDYYRLFLKRGVDKPVRLIGFMELKNIETGHDKAIQPAVRIGFDDDLRIGLTPATS